MVSQRNGESREAYLERHRERERKWREDNPERARERSREANRKYRLKHPERAAARWRKYRAEYPERVRAASRKYAQNHQAEQAACHAKRKGLGYIPLNNWFEGCHGHHIDMDQVIYIPAKLHMSVDHNMTTGKGMEEINALALAYWAGSEMT